MHDSRDILLTGSRVLSPARAFLRVEGAATTGITVDGGDLTKAAEPVAFADGAPRSSVKLRE